jgi:hypothetical protein
VQKSVHGSSADYQADHGNAPLITKIPIPAANAINGRLDTHPSTTAGKAHILALKIKPPTAVKGRACVLTWRFGLSQSNLGQIRLSVKAAPIMAMAKQPNVKKRSNTAHIDKCGNTAPMSNIPSTTTVMGRALKAHLTNKMWRARSGANVAPATV